MHPAELGLDVAMPCRPAKQMRQVTLAGQTLLMTMLACSEQGHVFSVAVVDVAEPARVAAVLAALRSAALLNVQGHVLDERTATVKGMTPHVGARQMNVIGQLPDGQAVREHLLVFSRGTRVYQAVALGASLEAGTAAHFFDSITATP